MIKNLKNSKGIAIQLEKSDKYYSPNIHLNIPSEISNVNFRFYVGAYFAKSEKYIPLISKGGNQVVMTINDNNREEFIQIAHNPYDENKVNPKDDNYFYYVIEFIEAELETLNIVVEYMEKKYNNKDTIGPNLKYVLGNKVVKVEDSYEQNYMRIVTIKCKNNLENKLKMKYEEYDMWSESLFNKYSFFELSAIYNGIGFDLQNKKNSVLFSYNYSNELIDIKNFEIELNAFYEQKEYSNSIKLKDNKLTSSKIEIGNYKDEKTKMYLLNTNKIDPNYDNICFLNTLSANDNVIIKEFESELVFKQEELFDGNWYLVVVKEFHNPLYFDMIVYSEKVIIKDGKISKGGTITFKEIKINEQQEVNEKDIYLYLNITKINGKEGSILFKGEITEDEYYINTVETNLKQEDINNDELYERFKAGNQVPNQFIKDPVTNNFELFYDKIDLEEDKRTILLIEIKLKERIGLKITPLSPPKELEIDEVTLKILRICINIISLFICFIIN